MVALPEHNQLYASDLLQYNRDKISFFHPVYLAELAVAVTRQGLTVERVWAMHMEPIPWNKITEALGVRR